MSYDYNDQNKINESENIGSGLGNAGSGDNINNAPEHPDTAQTDVPEKINSEPQAQKGTAETAGTQETQQVLWSEPAYESASKEKEEDIYTPGRYAYGAQNSHEAASKEEKKPRKKNGFLKAVCLVLVCALVSGATCWGVVDHLMDERGGTQVVLGSSQTNNAGSESGEDSTNADNTSHTGTTLTAQEIYELACQQAVGVNTQLTTNIFGMTSTQAVSGSGFIISDDGYIMTNFHVISYAVRYGGELTVLMHDGSSYPAEIVGYVEANDVAILKIDATGLTPVTLGNSDGMEVGEQVYAVGNPLGELTYTMTDGIVSALDRVITTQDETTGETQSINMFQISAAVNSGNSGGPVYNEYGEVIGIVTAKYNESGVEGLGFAIPINDAVSLATQLIEQGYVTGAALGVQVKNVTDMYQNFAIQYYNYPLGVSVVEVNTGSAAEDAGIRQGDIITAIDGESAESIDELQLLLRRYSPGDQATVTVYRMGQTLGEGEYVDLEVTFEESAAQTETNNSQQPGGQNAAE